MWKHYKQYKYLESDSNETIPTCWNFKRLNHIADLRRGPFGGALKVDSFVPSGFAVYEQQHAIHKNLGSIRYFINQDKYDEMSAFHVQTGDILLSCSGTIGQSVTIPYEFSEGIINQALLRIRLKSKELDLEYFKYYMDSYLFQTMITDSSHGSAMKNIASMSVINKVPIALPSFDEQLQIVKFLNNQLYFFDLLMSKKQELLRLLEEKRQAMITEAVTKGLNPNVKMKDSGVEWIGKIPKHWELTKMKYIGEAITGLTYSPNDLTEELGTIVLRSTNIQKGKISLHDNVYVDMNVPKKLFTRKNDILICSRNGSRNLIGKNALISGEHTELSFGAFTTVYRSQYNTFIYYVLNSGFFAAQLGTYLTTTINQLTIGNLNNMEIVMPPLEEQQEITQYLLEETTKINDLIGSIEKQIQKLKEYRQSLIYEAVTGKMDVRNFEVEKVMG